MGYAAHGVVYLLVGALAARVAFLHEGRTAGPQEAVAQAPGLLGGGALMTALLALIAVGLFAYAAWRFGQAAFDPDGDANKKHGALLRASRVVTGVIYSGVALSAAKLAIGRGEHKGDQAPEWTARALSAPFGVVIVVVAGLVLLAMGMVAAKKAWKATFLEELDLASLDDKKRKLVEGFGRAGYAARAIVFAIVGGFVIVAAVRHDPKEARGLGGALEALAAQPWGQWLLGATALGLAAFGAFEIARAIWRRPVSA